MATSDDAATYVGSCDITEPQDGDVISKGAAEVRQVKIQNKTSFPNITGAVTASHTELNYNDITTLGTAENSKTLTIDGSGGWTVAGKTCANLGTVTTVDINGGTIDGVTIGGSSKGAVSFSTLTGASGATITAILDEDTFSSDSATAVPTQQSTKAYVDAAIAASPEIEVSAALTLVAAGAWSGTAYTTASAAHGLGGTPDDLIAYLECTTAQDVWEIGDRIPVRAGSDFTTAQAFSFNLYSDATNVNLGHYTVVANRIMYLTDGSTATADNLLKANFKFVVRAIRYL